MRGLQKESGQVPIYLTLLVIGCHAGPRVAPRPEVLPAIPACPAPAVAVADWPLVEDSAGVTFRLPADYVERPPLSGAQYRRWDLGGDVAQSTAIGFIHSYEPMVALRRAPSIGMQEMTECIDSVAGREILVQAWRTVGGTFRNGRRQDKYEAFALIPVQPGLIVFLAGGGYDRRAQLLALATARTFRVFSP